MVQLPYQKTGALSNRHFTGGSSQVSLKLKNQLDFLLPNL